MSSLVEVAGICKEYVLGETRISVLKGIDLSIEEAEVVAVVGPSGVGKSTLLHILGALDQPTSGSLKIGDVDVLALGDEDLAAFRNRSIGFVFQFHHLLSDFTALENVMLPLLIQGKDQKQALFAARELLGSVGLSEREEHLPSELSGGESQRVAVARALVAGPQLVLADEPSGNLDADRSRELHDLIWRLSEELRQTFLIATHDPDLARRADRIIRLEDGQVAAPTVEKPNPTG